jgi:hypothetical protein
MKHMKRGSKLRNKVFPGGFVFYFIFMNVGLSVKSSV